MADPLPLAQGLGTQLRHILETLDADVAQACRDVGLEDYRTRYSPFIRALRELGPSSVRELARAVGVTHSAASQTIAQMSRSGYLSLETGPDARQRIVQLTPKTRGRLPAIEAEWVATNTALASLEAELPYPISALVQALATSLEQRSFRLRIGDAALAGTDPAGAPFRAALAGRPITDPIDH